MKASPEDEAMSRRRAAILGLLQDQLDSPEAPEVELHYQRLIALGHSDSATREMMASVLATYLWHLMRKDPYQHANFVAQLAALPVVPWQSE
jgi:hypothetical protein